VTVVRKLTALLTYKHDKRGLREFERSLDRLKGKMARVGEPVSKIKNSFEGVNRSTERLNRNLNKTNTQTSNLARNMINVQTLLASAATSFAAITGVNKIDETTNATARLNQAAKTYGVTLEELQKMSIDTANQTRAGFADTSKLFFRMADPARRAGKNIDQIAQAVSAVQAGLVIGGASTAEAQSSILQLSQALQSGELMGEELRALRENAGFLMERVAASIGVPIGALKEMGSQGKLTSEIMIDALIDVSSEMEGIMKEMPLTFGQTFTLLGNRFSSFFMKVARESNLFGRMAVGINTFFGGLEAGVDEAAKAVGGFTNLLKGLGIAGAGALLFKFRDALTKARSAAVALSGGLALLGKTFKLALGGGFLLLIDDMNAWRNGQKSVLNGVLGDYESFRIHAEGVFTNLFENTPIGPALMKLQAMIDSITFDKVMDSVFSFFDSTMEVINKLQSNLTDFISFITGQTAKEEAALAPILSPAAQAKQATERATNYNLGSFGFGGKSELFLPKSSVNMKVDKIEIKTTLDGNNAAEAGQEVFDNFMQRIKDIGPDFAQ
jgi:tape measure domain-containing protein